MERRKRHRGFLPNTPESLAAEASVALKGAGLELASCARGRGPSTALLQAPHPPESPHGILASDQPWGTFSSGRGWGSGEGSACSSGQLQRGYVPNMELGLEHIHCSKLVILQQYRSAILLARGACVGLSRCLGLLWHFYFFY